MARIHRRETAAAGGVPAISYLQGGDESLARVIYIHGTPDHEPMGVPFSHGCIRMHSAEICWLFD